MYTFCIYTFALLIYGLRFDFIHECTISWARIFSSVINGLKYDIIKSTIENMRSIGVDVADISQIKYPEPFLLNGYEF